MKVRETKQTGRVTRRHLAFSAVLGTLAPVTGQTPADEELRAAREAVARRRASIGKVSLAMATEPSFKFVP